MVKPLAALAGMVLLVGTAQSAFGKCDPANNASDAADVAAARAAVSANCTCDQTDPATVNHGQYVSCAAQQVNATTMANKACRGFAKKCAAKSTCGKPGPAVTCCKRNASGKVKCSTKPEAAKCTAPSGGEACASTAASCCDACNANNHPPCSPSGAFLDF